MTTKIGIWVMLALLLCAPALPAGPGTDMLVKRVLSRHFLAQHNLFDGRHVLMVKERLKLTLDQEKKIEKLMLAFEERSIYRSAEIKIMELHLASTLKSESLDREKVENQIREISRKKIDLSIAYLNYLLDIRAILTERQLSLLTEIKRKITRSLLNKSTPRLQAEKR